MSDVFAILFGNAALQAILILAVWVYVGICSLREPAISAETEERAEMRSMSWPSGL